MNEENKNLNSTAVSDNTPDTSAVKAEKNSVGKSGRKNKKTGKGSGKRGGFKSFMKSRKVRHGSVAAMIVAVVVAIVIVLNIVCSLLVDRFPSLKIDMTSNGAYALQEDTADYVSHLSKEVKMTVLMPKDAFESGGTYMVQAENLLDKMVNVSNGKLSLDYVDLNSNPSFTSKYTDVDWTNSDSNFILLVECGDQYKVLSLDECFEYDKEYYYYSGSLQITGTTIEQAVVTAILNVTTDDKVVVDIIKGHQEQDYSGISKLLSNNAYQVNEVSLATGNIDENAEIVILYAPAVDLDDNAVEKLSSWLDNNGDYGKTLIYMPAADMGDTPNLDDFLSQWGIAVDKGYVFETSNDYILNNSRPYAFVVDYNDYYTDGLKNPSIPCVVSDSHQIKVTDENTAHTILQTSDAAGVYPLDAQEDWDYKDAIAGEPVSVAAEGVKTNTNEETSNVVVFGSYLMFTDSYMQYTSFNNSAFFMNVCNANSDKSDNSIVIESKSLESTELGVTDVSTKNVIMVIFVIAVPVIVLVTGLVLWIRRRNK